MSELGFGPLRVGAAAVLLCLFLGAWVAVAYNGVSTEQMVELNRAHPLVAPVLFIVVHCIAAAVLLPCSVLTVAAGLMWGAWLGFAISVIAALSASSVTFLIARYLTGPATLDRMVESVPGRLLMKLGALGWKGVAFAQLNPVVPASALGYLFGLSPLPFRTYVWTALLFILPLQIIFVGIGASLRGPLFGEGAAYVPLLVALAAASLYAGVRYFVRSRRLEVQ
jgi:uncharacterized membrane protein YdjX (TVP38/TMEM64 family)